ncbi:hypothetical protein [uncultured Methanobrevibacter sp.]|uniref:hypothetical protein n=1 Tax=uncultured Methanobrevibacter sp. TaxID=253161 RepID=UPI0026310B61|nr:hypothetical protein [uncultured Methanobrevibacter sp.]
MSKEFDVDEEIEKLSRKTNINMRRTEYAFDNQLRKLEKDIDHIVKDKINNFDENKELSTKYLNIDYSSDSIDRYKKRLKKI